MNLFSLSKCYPHLKRTATYTRSQLHHCIRKSTEISFKMSAEEVAVVETVVEEEVIEPEEVSYLAKDATQRCSMG